MKLTTTTPTLTKTLTALAFSAVLTLTSAHAAEPSKPSGDVVDGSHSNPNIMSDHHTSLGHAAVAADGRAMRERLRAWLEQQNNIALRPFEVKFPK